MAGDVTPSVLILDRCRVTYRGRAKAQQRGGRLVVLVKRDGSVCAHSLAKGIRPQFYNPPGSVSIRRKGKRLHVESVSEGGEYLRITGRPELFEKMEEPKGTTRPPRRRVAGRERDLVEWITSDPSLLGLEDERWVREVNQVGGRVDLRFESTVVEVKMVADVTTYDQARRYFRDPTVSRVKVVCLRATKNLQQLCKGDDGVELTVLDEDGFKAFLQDG